MSQTEMDNVELKSSSPEAPSSGGLASVFSDVLFLVTVLTLLYPWMRMTFKGLGRDFLKQLLLVLQVLLTFVIVALLLLVLVAQQMRVSYCAFIRPFVGITVEDKIYTSAVLKILVFFFLCLNYVLAYVGQRLLHFVVENVYNRNNNNIIIHRTNSILRPSPHASFILSDCSVSPVPLQQQQPRCVFRDAETLTQWIGVNTNFCALTTSHQERNEEASLPHEVVSQATQTMETVEHRRSFLAFDENGQHSCYAVREEEITRCESVADLESEHASFQNIRVDINRDVVNDDGEQQETLSWLLRVVHDKITPVSNCEASREDPSFCDVALDPIRSGLHRPSLRRMLPPFLPKMTRSGKRYG